MIERLSIKNYAIIESLELEFGKGFHVFTGETGAGKSIIVGALGLLLGDKADATVIRTGADKAIVEAEFTADNPNVADKLRELGIDEPETLILRREVAAGGKSRAFVNGNQQTVSVLEEIGQWLVDIHGQHDHQLLLQQKVHIDLLDAYAGLMPDRKTAGEILASLQQAVREKEELESDEARLEAERLFWQTAVDDVGKAAFDPGEEDELKHQLDRTEYAERIQDAISGAYSKLYSDDVSVSSRLTRAIADLRTISDIDPKYGELVDILEDAATKIDETSKLLSDYRGEVNISAADIDAITDRLALIKDLKRKYKKNTVQELNAYARECGERLERFENRAFELEKLAKTIDDLKSRYLEAALQLSRKRQEASKRLSQDVKSELAFLGMDKSEFVTDIKYVRDDSSLIQVQGSPVKMTANGIDRVEFLLSSNVGQEARPLVKVASGGEISRVMLALKTILSGADSVDTLIFDEIDVGIGGITANNVARKMRDLADSKQLIVITHLAQIASRSGTHFTVSKSVEGGKTVTSVEELDSGKRVEEIARMLGGESAAAIAHAEEMLGEK